MCLCVSVCVGGGGTLALCTLALLLFGGGWPSREHVHHYGASVNDGNCNELATKVISGLVLLVGAGCSKFLCLCMCACSTCILGGGGATAENTRIIYGRLFNGITCKELATQMIGRGGGWVCNYNVFVCGLCRPLPGVCAENVDRPTPSTVTNWPHR